MLNMFKYAWIYLNNQSSEYARIFDGSDAGHLKLEWFLREPKWVLLHDLQKSHLKAFLSHLQSLALPSQKLISKR